MAELIVEPIQTAELESSGYAGQPEGNINLTENNVQVNVAPYKYATPKIPIQEDVPAVNPSTQEQTIVPDIGYEGMKSVKVNPANLETKRVTPTTEEQTVVPQSPAIGFLQFTVEPVTPSIDPDIQPENIKQGVDILGVQGTLKPPTLITKQITENGTYTAADDNADGYSEVTVDVSSLEEKAVNFYDYDGTILYAYTAQEALALTELPEAPTHEGLTFQGWNRTLAQLQAYVTDYGIGDAGATYITDDGATRLYLEVGQNVPLDYTLYCQIANGTLSVEVDGVELGSATGTTSAYGNYTIPFTLPNRGNVRVDLKFTGTGGFHIGQGAVRTRVFGWNSEQNDSLVKVELGEHITSTYNYAFQGCASLNSVVIPQGVTSIGAYVFQGCSLLNSVVIPQGVTSIGTYVFYNCTSLNNVVIPSSVTSISNNAFYNCISLNNVVIPSSITHIYDYAFNNCASLNSIVIPSSVTSISAYAFNNCASLNSIVIPSSVTSIGIYTFYNCISLNNVIIPSSVTSISIGAFYGCTSLNSIVIPQGVTSISGSAFSGCTSLNSVVIPSSVTSIGTYAFYNCSLLLFFDLSQYTDSNNLPTFSNSNFLYGTPTDQIIYVANQEMLTAFSNAPNISVYASRMVIKT